MVMSKYPGRSSSESTWALTGKIAISFMNTLLLSQLNTPFSSGAIWVLPHGLARLLMPVLIKLKQSVVCQIGSSHWLTVSLVCGCVRARTCVVGTTAYQMDCTTRCVVVLLCTIWLVTYNIHKPFTTVGKHHMAKAVLWTDVIIKRTSC